MGGHGDTVSSWKPFQFVHRWTNFVSSTGMPTCLLCVCISGSVYCDDAELDQIPPLPKDTTHFYARFNSIKRLQTKDFVHLSNRTFTKTDHVFLFVHILQNAEWIRGQSVGTEFELAYLGQQVS